MTTTFFDSALVSKSSSALLQLIISLIEPLLIMFAAVFWIVMLPFMALSVLCVKAWDTLVALNSGGTPRSDSLFLRRIDSAKSASSLASHSTGHV